ncbi:MAG: rhomboid family intramembrane serine protease [Planctomycetaceae bacterium]|nr:rhomboid family intramembrane serine protease [Planctomycetaceae bacterium]
MGIENRDYYRDEERRARMQAGLPSVNSWPVWQRLVSITFLVFVMQLLFAGFTSWFSLSARDVFQHGQVWRLLTYAFLHAPQDIFHILFNMLLLYFFGRRLESMYGSREFGLFYCVSAVFAGICFLGFDLYFHDLASAIGASGAVIAVTILYALHFPHERIYLWGLIAVEMRWLAAFILIIDLHPVLLQLGGGQSLDQVAHTAHLGGALFAWLYYTRALRLSRWLTWPQEWRILRGGSRHTRLKVYRGDLDENLDGEVDRILAKIQEQGESSLSDAERRTLQKASERYKNRNS